MKLSNIFSTRPFKKIYSDPKTIRTKLNISPRPDLPYKGERTAMGQKRQEYGERKRG